MLKKTKNIGLKFPRGATVEMSNFLNAFSIKSHEVVIRRDSISNIPIRWNDKSKFILFLKNKVKINESKNDKKIIGGILFFIKSSFIIIALKEKNVAEINTSITQFILFNWTLFI